MNFQNIYTFTYQKILLHAFLLLVFKIAESLQCILNYIHMEKDPTNETSALTKSMNMNIWIIGTSNQLFIRGSYAETKFPK